MLIDSDRCFECGEVGDIHYHHVVPKALGGTRTIPLCIVCHGKVHGRDFVKAKRLQAEGIAKAKQAGKYQGRQPIAQDKRDAIMRDLQAGESIRTTASNHSVGISTVQRIKKEHSKLILIKGGERTCRAIVSCRLGDEVEIPDELVR